MLHLTYPLARLWPDYFRAGAGLLVTVGLMLFAEPVSVIFWLLLALSLLLGWLALHTLWRQQAGFDIDDRGVAQAGRWVRQRPRAVAWSEMRRLRLRYFSTRRDRSRGWMVLTIAGDRVKLRADSDLDGFDRLVAHALAWADRQGLAVDADTRENAARLAAGILQDGRTETGR